MGQRWSPEADQVLKDRYPKEGIRLCSVLKRTAGAIRERAYQLGVKLEKPNGWKNQTFVIKGRGK